jgi:hypothetical protein
MYLLEQVFQVIGIQGLWKPIPRMFMGKGVFGRAVRAKAA